MRLRINGPHAIVVADARPESRRAKSRSPAKLSRNFRNSDFAPASRTALSIASGRGSTSCPLGREEQARVASLTSTLRKSKLSSRASARPEWANRSISGIGAGKRALDPLRPDDRCRRSHDRVRRVARLARRICGNERRIADQVDLGRDCDVEHGAIVRIRDLVHQRKREIRLERLAARDRAPEWPCTLVTCVLSSMTVAPELSFMFWRGMTAPICLSSAAIWAS